MNKKRRSRIWFMPKKEFEELVKSKTSIADISRHFGYATTGKAHKLVRQRCEEENIDISHIPSGLNSNKGRKFPSPANTIPLEKVMVKNSTYDRKNLKRRLLKNGMLENICSECGQKGEWQGKELRMVLDHINGVNNDHRLENLQMLCPNCNSQQKTFSGRNNKK